MKALFFVDTTVLVGAADRNDDFHGPAARILERVATGAGGIALTSDFVLDETATILGRRRGVGAARAVQFVNGILASPRVRCLYVTDAVFRQALETYRRFGATLSLTDATTVVLMGQAGCKSLFSHDGGFDRVPGLLRVSDVESAGS